MTEIHVIALSIDSASNVSQLAFRCLATLPLSGIHEAISFVLPFVCLAKKAICFMQCFTFSHNK